MNVAATRRVALCFTACFLIFTSIPAFCQSAYDSLLRLTASAAPDTLKADQFVRLARLAPNDSLATHFAQESLTFATLSGDRLRICLAYFELTSINDRRNDFDAARRYLDEVKKQLVHFDNVKVRAKMLMYYGIIDYLQSAYSRSVKNLFDAMRLYEQLGDSVTVASCLLNLGNCYTEINKTDEALESYTRGLDIYLAKDNDRLAAMAYGNIGRIHSRKGDLIKALDCFNRSLDFNRKNHLLRDAAVDLNNIGTLYLGQKEYEMALPYFLEAQSIADSLEMSSWAVYTLNIGTVHLYLSQSLRAIGELKQSLAMASTFKDKDTMMEANRMLSLAYEGKGNFETALQHRKEYEVLYDSIHNETHLNEVKRLQLGYESDRKDQQIALLAKDGLLSAKEADRQSLLKNASLAGLGMAMVILILTGYTYRQRLKSQRQLSGKDNELREANFNRQMSELELRALRAQINPHFLFNCMNSINWMILDGENEAASQYLAKFSKLMRQILENAESARVSLKSELSLLESYIQLEVLRLKDRINYVIEVDPALDPDEKYLPSMILQPFVENAIWHGLMHKSDNLPGTVRISVSEKEGRLCCVIEDNGIGREKARELAEGSVLKSKSMGIKITQERLRLISRKGWENLINIIDLKDSLNRALGTRVVINLPEELA
jgi:tetratricopeptide (TPR) repeat protein